MSTVYQLDRSEESFTYNSAMTSSTSEYYPQYYAQYYQQPGSYSQQAYQPIYCSPGQVYPPPSQPHYQQSSQTYAQQQSAPSNTDDKPPTTTTTQDSGSTSATVSQANQGWYSQWPPASTGTTPSQWPPASAGTTPSQWPPASAGTTPSQWPSASTGTTPSQWPSASTGTTPSQWPPASTGTTPSQWPSASTGTTPSQWPSASTGTTPSQWPPASTGTTPSQWGTYNAWMPWGVWPPPPSPWLLPPPGQAAWGGTYQQTSAQADKERAKSPGTPPLPDETADQDNSDTIQQTVENGGTSPTDKVKAGSKHGRSEASDEEMSSQKRLRSDSPKQTEEQSDTSNKWPPKMKEYVTRAFAACITAEEREYVHHVLDEQLNSLFSESKQWSIDWDTYPLPTERVRKTKTSSRWDTPSPPRTPYKGGVVSDGRTMGGVVSDGRTMGGVVSDSRTMGGMVSDGCTVGGVASDSRTMGGVARTGIAIGRGRGKKKKKNKKWGAVGKMAGPSAEDQKRLTERAQRFGKQGAAEGNRNFKKKISVDELLKRSLTPGGEEVYWQDSNIEGTCQSLEKRYLRLTSAPEPGAVRPLSVLKRSLEHVCSKWAANRDYHYACEQLKSIRQDLTIQAIRNDFTVLVYETHGRVALENSDHQEFNQCQTQLKSLYSEGLSGNQAEFVAYRLLYYILTDSSADMSSALLGLTDDFRLTPCVEHALQVCSAWSLGNYHRLFALYQPAPNLSGQLIKLFSNRERKKALQAMTKAYRPSLTVDYICSQLKFSSRDECLEFLTTHNAVLDISQTIVDCKQTAAKL